MLNLDCMNNKFSFGVNFSLDFNCMLNCLLFKRCPPKVGRSGHCSVIFKKVKV